MTNAQPSEGRTLVPAIPRVAQHTLFCCTPEKHAAIEAAAIPRVMEPTADSVRVDPGDEVDWPLMRLLSPGQEN